MSDEDQGNKNGNQEEEEEDAEAKGDKKPKATDFLKKKAAEARDRRGASDAAALAEARKDAAEKTFGLDLDGIEDDDLRAAIKGALGKGKTAAEAASGLAAYSMAQAARAKAYEIAADLDMLDDVEDIVTLLGTATSPKELNLQAREVRLELAGDKKPAKKLDGKSRTDEDGKGSGSRKFDDGRGRGGNVTAELVKKINDIDPSDPDSQKELDKLYADVQKAVERSTKRA